MSPYDPARITAARQLIADIEAQDGRLSANAATACSPFGLSRFASHRFAHRPTGAGRL